MVGLACLSCIWCWQRCSCGEIYGKCTECFVMLVSTIPKGRSVKGLHHQVCIWYLAVAVNLYSASCPSLHNLQHLDILLKLCSSSGWWTYVLYNTYLNVKDLSTGLKGPLCSCSNWGCGGIRRLVHELANSHTTPCCLQLGSMTVELLLTFLSLLAPVHWGSDICLGGDSPSLFRCCNLVKATLKYLLALVCEDYSMAGSQ